MTKPRGRRIASQVARKIASCTRPLITIAILPFRNELCIQKHNFIWEWYIFPHGGLMKPPVTGDACSFYVVLSMMYA